MKNFSLRRLPEIIMGEVGERGNDEREQKEANGIVSFFLSSNKRRQIKEKPWLEETSSYFLRWSLNEIWKVRNSTSQEHSTLVPIIEMAIYITQKKKNLKIPECLKIESIWKKLYHTCRRVCKSRDNFSQVFTCILSTGVGWGRGCSLHPSLSGGHLGIWLGFHPYSGSVLIAGSHLRDGH